MKVRDLINEVQSIQGEETLNEAIDVTAVKKAINDIISKFEVPGVPLTATAAYKAFSDAYSRARGRKEYNSEEVEEVADKFAALQSINVKNLKFVSDEAKKYITDKFEEIKSMMIKLTKEDESLKWGTA